MIMKQVKGGCRMTDKKNKVMDPEKTKELQKDWQGYGK